MAELAQTIGAIVFLLLILLAISLFPYNPYLSLIVMFIAIISIAMTTDPSSAKIMMKLFTPVIVLLLFLALIFDIVGEIGSQMFLIIILVLFGAGILITSLIGGLDVGSGIVLAPMIIVPTLLAFLIDPSGRLSILIGSILMFGWVFFVYLLVRKLPPPIEIGFSTKVATAITDLNPEGKVKIGAEIWKAEVKGRDVRKGEIVLIIGKEGLILHVVPARKCPSCGKVFPEEEIRDVCPSCGYYFESGR